MSRFPPKRVLVPVDFSKPSMAALKAALDLARRFKAHLELLHVVELPRAMAPYYYPPEIVAKRWREYHRNVRSRLLALAGGFPAGRLSLRSVSAVSPEMAMFERALAMRGGLIVIGTHGRTGLERALHGSKTEALVHLTTAPVLSLHERAAAPSIRKILAPMNDSPYALRGLKAAFLWAKAFGARLTILHAAQEEDPEAVLKKLERQASRLAARGTPPRWDIVLREGKPELAILQEAKRGAFDLVVLTAHRKPFFREHTLGMTVCRVLRHSPVPVLAVPNR